MSINPSIFNRVDWDDHVYGMEYLDKEPEPECGPDVLTCGKCQWCCADEIRDAEMDKDFDQL